MKRFTFFKIAEFKCFSLKMSSLKAMFTLSKFSLGTFKSKCHFRFADQNGNTSVCDPGSDYIIFIIFTVNLTSFDECL